MTKDVLISVSGLQMGEEKPEQIEVISKGKTVIPMCFMMK